MEPNKTTSLQDHFLDALCKDRIPLSIYLSNGIRLQGRIEAFDAYIVLLKGGDHILQAIYKHAMSTIVPSQPVSLATGHAAETEHATPEVIERTAPEIVIKKKRTALGLRRISDHALAE